MGLSQRQVSVRFSFSFAYVMIRCTGVEVNPEEPQLTQLICASTKKGEKVYVCDKWQRIIANGTIEFQVCNFTLSLQLPCRALLTLVQSLMLG